MKRLFIIPLAVTVAAAGLFAAPSPAAADVIMPPETPRISAKRCTVAQGRITNINDTLLVVSERRSITYTNISERTASRVKVLKQKGYDTSKLEADIQTVKDQIKDHHDKVAALRAALTVAQDTACGDDKAAFKDALSDARSELKAVRESAQVIHQTIRSKIVADIKAAATWVKNK